jgi:hypothetical protein
VNQLLDDLETIKAQLAEPSSNVLSAFNDQLRTTIPHASLSQEDAQRLNALFGEALTSAKATPQEVANLQADMSNLALVDSKSIQPVMLATNDYSLVLQVAIGVGQPIPKPAAPSLAPADHIGKTGQFTTKTQPHLVGTYDAGATIEIVDTSNNVLGSAVVAKNGKYSVQFAQPLSVGEHVVGVRASEEGVFSAVSNTITIRVLSPPKRRAH